MKKTKYVPQDNNRYYINLTVNKVYDVISYSNNIIYLLDDDDKPYYFYEFSIYASSISEFVDATEEYRSNVINEILL